MAAKTKKTKSKYSKKSEAQARIAKERIDTLFAEAKNAFREDPSLSHRYVQLARKIAMKYKLKIPSKYRRQYCKHCYRYLMPGENSRVRTREGKLVVYCLECKKYSRYVIKRKLGHRCFSPSHTVSRSSAD